MENAINLTHVLDAIKNVNNGEEIGLRAFAEVLGITPTRLYAKAKTPIAGEVYDPEAINWDALNDYFCTKLTEDGAEITTMEALVEAAKAKEEWLKANKPVRASAGANLIEVDGNKVPKRKAAIFEMDTENESLLCFKHDAGVYKMVYQTLGYTCIREVNEDGSFAKEEIRVISNGTLNTKCVAPATMADAIKERFSGEYSEAEKVAAPDNLTAEQ